MKNIKDYKTIKEFCNDFKKEFKKEATFDDFYSKNCWDFEGKYHPFELKQENKPA